MQVQKLEDEFGDIIAKARRGLGLSAQQLAGQVGLPATKISAIEAYEFTPDRETVARLAATLKLDAGKLAAIALDGWLPAPKNLRDWGNLAVIPSDYGGYEVKCYLQWDDAGNAALFDTGVDAAAVFRVVAGENLKLSHVFFTHSHADHVEALPEISRKFPNLQVVGLRQAVPETAVYRVASLRVTGFNTPGHSADGITWVVRDNESRPAIAYVGDALFAGSVGGPGHSYEKLLKNGREKILSLPDQTLLCPGHGPLTTVAEENSHNPFFR
jgi:hydroxyacylglutathione hydrolase